MVAPGVGSASARWLFSEHFLAERLPEWEEFRRADPADVHRALVEIWERERESLRNANEGHTEDRFIRPVLDVLRNAYTLGPEIPGTGKKPDYLFYTSPAERNAAEQAGPDAKVERSAAVGDAKRFDLPLDRRAAEGDPVAQVRDYVLLTRRPFGILTNGRVWRLYARDSGIVERACHEIDLVRLLEEGATGDLRYFTLFFGAESFLPGDDGRSFLERALDDNALHAVHVSDALERAVFAAIPPLATGFIAGETRNRETLDAAFANSLVFLYRVLFCLFAESRNLLPISSSDYRLYSIAEQRLELARRLDRQQRLSETSDTLYQELQALFRLIDRGDAALGVTEYDGGLFNPTEHPWLEGRSVPDSQLASALAGIYRVDQELVDYRDLSVRTLGAVYEKLLAWELEERDGELVLAESPRRHELGSYFTPERIVDVIVERTLDPILGRISREVGEAGLSGENALDALLEVRVLDPAMGSGHFLVGAAEYLAQSIATDPSYDGDLSLADLRRLAAERCIYGVDLNPLAVELARLSLWLVTAHPGEPLTFLANLRVGDSLVGADTETLLDPMTGLLEAHIAEHSAELLRQVRDLQHRTTRTGTDAREKQLLAEQIESIRLPLEVFADQAIERFGPPAERQRLHWPLEFPEVFVDDRGQPRDDGGFDVVIGNPPYIRVQEIGRDVADYCRARFACATGGFDAYVVFIERGLALLSERGRLGFIVPNKLFKLDFAARIRARFSDQELVAEVLDFGATQLFRGVVNYTCIIVLDRAGRPEVEYRRITGSREEVLDGLAAVDGVPSERFAQGEFGGDPWVLVPPEEAALIRKAMEGAEPLHAVTNQIFQGPIPGADPIYVLQDRGTRGDLQVVYSRASNEQLELEPDLLRLTATGADVESYAFRRLRSLVLFPYVAVGQREPRLVRLDELEALPRTLDYLRRHEDALRTRDGRQMDRNDRWWGFSRPQNLNAQALPKLGVAATVRNLEIAADPEGAICFRNVRVNGIIPRDDGPSLSTLLALLNSRLLDWIFRRGAGIHANDFYAANRQFIANLPIRASQETYAAELDALGRRLHELARTVLEEREGFVGWLAGALSVSRATVPAEARLARPEDLTGAEFLALLDGLRSELGIDLRERALRALLEREHNASVERIVPMVTELHRARRQTDDLVYDLYELPAEMRQRVDAEYPT